MNFPTFDNQSDIVARALKLNAEAASKKHSAPPGRAQASASSRSGTQQQSLKKRPAKPKQPSKPRPRYSRWELHAIVQVQHHTHCACGSEMVSVNPQLFINERDVYTGTLHWRPAKVSELQLPLARKVKHLNGAHVMQCPSCFRAQGEFDEQLSLFPDLEHIILREQIIEESAEVIYKRLIKDERARKRQDSSDDSDGVDESSESTRELTDISWEDL